jgi:hypothetical protein
MRETKLDRTELVAYLEDNESMDFVEKASAEEEVKGSAKDAGYEIEDYG